MGQQRQIDKADGMSVHPRSRPACRTVALPAGTTTASGTQFIASCMHEHAELFKRRFAPETFDLLFHCAQISPFPPFGLDTGFFGQRELMMRKPRAPAMSKEAMRQESERLVREAMARNVTITQCKTRLDVKCSMCGAPNRVTAEVGHGRVEYACKECGHKQKTL